MKQVIQKEEKELKMEKNIRVAMYARVSSDKQAKEGTIESQIAVLKKRILSDGFMLRSELFFIDEGYSGTILIRPALESLRDQASLGLFEWLYVYDPSRLARKYAYQVLLIEELQRYGIKTIFLNNAFGDKPEDNLLIQVQGMIAEYERAKILERSRRGKLHAARRGSLSVLANAPYGYRYIKGDKYGYKNRKR